MSGCCLSGCCCPQLYELRQLRKQLWNEQKEKTKVEEQNTLLDKAHAQLQVKLETMTTQHREQSKELKAQLVQAKSRLQELQHQHTKLQAMPSIEDMENERKKVKSEHLQRFRELEQKGNDDVEAERRKGMELLRGHEVVNALKAKISQMLEHSTAYELQARVHVKNQAEAAARIQQVDALNRSLAMDNEKIAYRLQELESGGQRYDALAVQHDDYQAKVMQLETQLRQSKELSAEIIRQEQVQAGLMNETNILEARVLQAANVAAERGEKVNAISMDLESLKLRQQELQASQLPQHAELTNMLLSSEVSEREAQAELLRIEEELARLRQEAAQTPPQMLSESPAPEEISALLSELDAAKVAMRKNEVRLDKMRQRQERQERLAAQAAEPKPRPTSKSRSIPQEKPSAPSKARGAPPAATAARSQAAVEAMVVEKFSADPLDPNSLSLELGEKVSVVASSGAWATVKTAAGQTGVAPLVCLQLQETPQTVPPARDIRPKTGPASAARTGRSPTGVPKAAPKPKVTSPAVRASAAERQQRLSGTGVRQGGAGTGPQSLRARAAGTGGYSGVSTRPGRSALDKPVLRSRGHNSSLRSDDMAATSSASGSPVVSPGASLTPDATGFPYPS